MSNLTFVKPGNSDFYKNKFNLYGDDVKALGWGSTKSQEERFEILSQIGICSGDSVLDVGCAFGDFYKFLENKQLEINYVGVDIKEEFISLALEKKYKNANFLVGDVHLIEDDYDWVVASGMFGLEYTSWEEVSYQTIKKMITISNKGVSINFLSTLSGHQTEEDISKHVDPDFVLRTLIQPLSKKFVVRHDYRTNDFSVYLYK